MEGHCSTGQSPQWAVVPLEEVEDEEEEEEEEYCFIFYNAKSISASVAKVCTLVALEVDRGFGSHSRGTRTGT